ncbi:hypothetical protein R1flu_023335 [Riccia fluitans]|uniref:Uncharacterized protein n=1 Tax=Riccia fluitans TaxID=41844 RepID=A0ABD1XSJ2_9MARC
MTMTGLLVEIGLRLGMYRSQTDSWLEGVEDEDDYRGLIRVSVEDEFDIKTRTSSEESESDVGNREMHGFFLKL